MQIRLKNNWKFIEIKLKHKFYVLSVNKWAVVDETLNKMHAQSRLEWNQESTEYSFPVFVVWWTVYKNEKLIWKDWAVMNIWGFNQAAISDAYLLSLQSDITAAIAECRYISVMNDKDFFYQWWIAKADWEKLMIVSHWKLKTFNVVLMSYKESSLYSQ